MSSFDVIKTLLPFISEAEKTILISLVKNDIDKDNASKQIQSVSNITDTLKEEDLLEEFNNLSINIDMPKDDKIHSSKNEINIWNIISKNDYINKVKNKTESIHSFSSLVSRKDLDQSQKITLGLCIEYLLNDIISLSSDWKNLNNLKNTKGLKQKDSLWINELTKTIIYAEYKANLELDTEKSVETDKKCQIIFNELKENYPDYNIKPYLVGLRYLRNNETIMANILKKYKLTTVLGVDDYLELFNMKVMGDYDEYKKVLNHIVDLKFPISN
jgi:hypothetical protein